MLKLVLQWVLQPAAERAARMAAEPHRDRTYLCYRASRRNTYTRAIPAKAQTLTNIRPARDVGEQGHATTRDPANPPQRTAAVRAFRRGASV